MRSGHVPLRRNCPDPSILMMAWGASSTQCSIGCATSSTSDTRRRCSCANAGALASTWLLRGGRSLRANLGGSRPGASGPIDPIMGMPAPFPGSRRRSSIHLDMMAHARWRSRRTNSERDGCSPQSHILASRRHGEREIIVQASAILVSHAEAERAVSELRRCYSTPDFSVSSTPVPMNPRRAPQW
jgi:hypothetical protein